MTIRDWLIHRFAKKLAMKNVFIIALVILFASCEDRIERGEFYVGTDSVHVLLDIYSSKSAIQVNSDLFTFNHSFENYELLPGGSENSFSEYDVTFYSEIDSVYVGILKHSLKSYSASCFPYLDIFSIDEDDFYYSHSRKSTLDKDSCYFIKYLHHSYEIIQKDLIKYSEYYISCRNKSPSSISHLCKSYRFFDINESDTTQIYNVEYIFIMDSSFMSEKLFQKMKSFKCMTIKERPIDLG